MRIWQRAGFAAAVLMAMAWASFLGNATTAVSPGSLPPDFAPRFLNACVQRGLSPARCACMSDVVLREVADEHLALMIDYLENPTGFDTRAMQELDNDENRMRVLEEEIASAQTMARSECRSP